MRAEPHALPVFDRHIIDQEERRKQRLRDQSSGYRL